MSEQTQIGKQTEEYDDLTWRYGLKVGQLADTKPSCGEWLLSIVKSISTPEGRHNRIHSRVELIQCRCGERLPEPYIVDLFDFQNMQKAYTASCSPLHHAAAEGGPEEVKRLIKAGAVVNDFTNSSGNPPLHAAIYHANLETAKLLLKRGAALNANPAGGGVSVDLFLSFPNEPLTRLLVRRGSKVNSSFSSHAPTGIPRRTYQLGRQQLTAATGQGDGLKPLHFWAREGHRGVCQLLIRGGADVNAEQDGFGITPLHACAGSEADATGLKETCELLIERGAKLNAKSTTGETALHLAARHGNLSVCELLIGRGADTRAETSTSPFCPGATPHELAQLYGHAEVAALLLASLNGDGVTEEEEVRSGEQ